MIVIFHAAPVCSAEKAVELVANGGFLVEDGTGTRQHRAEELFIPASTLKIVTCLAALEILGSDYRFETHFFVDAGKNLYIKGYGDPFLTSETVLDIGQQLYALGIHRISSIFLDDTVFALDGPTAGSENSARAYDVPNGALAVNFNALPIRVDKNGTIGSGEPQTPSLPLMQEIGSRLPPGFHRVNLTAFPTPPTISPTLRYSGELFSAQLQRAGLVVENGLQARMVPKNLIPVLIHRNALTLAEMVRACLKSSNNFIANQLYLACGLKSSGPPATWEKSRLLLADYLETTLDIQPEEMQMVEGSGLSRQNRLTATALVRILNRFSPYAYLLNLHDGIPLKTGTMSDIFCYAGYFEEDDKLVPFAILLNQEKNTRERILKLLQRGNNSTAALLTSDLPATTAP
jgi:D-alanyl-D-alanine carboxypeptidase/D-alanyl-D-alanine-endopeptidase (penicillin-binding protein 4)